MDENLNDTSQDINEPTRQERRVPWKVMRLFLVLLAGVAAVVVLLGIQNYVNSSNLAEHERKVDAALSANIAASNQIVKNIYGSDLALFTETRSKNERTSSKFYLINNADLAKITKTPVTKGFIDINAYGTGGTPEACAAVITDSISAPTSQPRGAVCVYTTKNSDQGIQIVADGKKVYVIGFDQATYDVFTGTLAN